MNEAGRGVKNQNESFLYTLFGAFAILCPILFCLFVSTFSLVHNPNPNSTLCHYSSLDSQSVYSTVRFASPNSISVSQSECTAFQSPACSSNQTNLISTLPHRPARRLRFGFRRSPHCQEKPNSKTRDIST